MFSNEQPSRANDTRPNMREELSKLKFEKKNQYMPKLPATLTVERRPLIHPPIASPFAGAAVQKVVYVSRNTPLMSAVKRVKKLLLHVEKRAVQGVDLTKDRNGLKKLADANEKLGQDSEKVLVKASGRAMEQALRVGDWFRNREDELACNVEVRTGSVQAVDDIVEKKVDDTMSDLQPSELEAAPGLTEAHNLSLFTTSDDSKISSQPVVRSSNPNDDSARQPSDQDTANRAAEAGNEQDDKKRRRRGKRKNEVLDEDTAARIRWVKTVEVAISFKN